MHSSRMRTTHSSSRPGGSPPGTPWTRLPGAGDPGSRHPPGPDPPRDQTPPWTRHPPRTRHPPKDQTPPLGPGPTSLCGQTHTCKHITLPQTSFAGGKNLKFIRSTQLVTTVTWHSTVNCLTNITDDITFVTSSVLISWTTLQSNWCKNLPST